MGLFNKVKKAMSFEKTERKPNALDRAFSSLEEKMSTGFDVLEQQMEVYGAASQKLYDAVDRAHAEYADAFTPRETKLYNEVQELTERIDSMFMRDDDDHRRYLMTKRENLHNELADMLCENEALPEDIRAEIDQAMRECDEAEPQALKKAERFLSFIPGKTHSMEIGNTFIQWR